MQKWAMLALLGISAWANAAEVYRWVDEKGVVNYTPYPPPASIKKVEQKKFSSNTVQTSDTPYSVQLATKNFPITLYATPDCGPCKTARAHLEKRGIPYTEKNPSAPEEADNFQTLTGGTREVPLLLVGQLKTLKGYLASEWDTALDQAGYPSTAIPGAKTAAKPPAQPAAAK